MDNYDLQVDVGKRIFLQFDQEQLIRKFSLDTDDRYLYLTYLNTSTRICRLSGTVEELVAGKWRECRAYATVMTIYDLLCYHKGTFLPQPSGQWCTVGTFIVTGITETEGMTRAYAKLFDGHPDALKQACEAIGGVIQPSMAGADITCCIPVTTFFSVLLQFWEGDDEFPPKLLVLWDSNTEQLLHFETTFYLQGDLLNRLRNIILHQGESL